jgi:hypothetical protein
MINCIIIDDEPLARKGLMEYIREVDFLQLSGEFDSPLKAMASPVKYHSHCSSSISRCLK